LHPKKLVENQFVLQALRHLIQRDYKNSTIQRVAILIVSSPKEPPLAEGSKRVKSSADLEIVGKAVNSFLPMVVSAPVLPLPNF
jgi:hypothetical protein